MASIYLPVFRAWNSNGVLASGAGLWVYETGTTTPADIFTDDAMTTPAANPLTSDSSGYFPQFFIASNSTVDLQCRVLVSSSSSTLLWQALDIDSLGAEDLSTFIRDFGDNGRVQFIGRAGAVNLEFGDPDGDDVGGSGRLGGWNDTPGDSLTLDFATTTVTGDLALTGDLSVTGSMPSEKVLSSATAAAASTIDIPLTGDFKVYRILIAGLTTSGSSIALSARLAFDDVPTFKTGADDYAWAYYLLSTGTNSTGSAAGGKDPSDDKLTVASAVSSTTADNGGAEIIIRTSATEETQVEGRFTHTSGSYEMTITPFVGQTRGKAYGKATYLRIYPSSGTVALRYVVMGVPSL